MSDPAKKDGENLLNIREEDGPEGAKGMAEVCERTNMMTITESNQNLTNVNIPVYQTETPLGDETTPKSTSSTHHYNTFHSQQTKTSPTIIFMVHFAKNIITQTDKTNQTHSRTTMA